MKLEREDEKGDIRRILSSDYGRRFVQARLESAGVFRSTFAHDALSMAFAEGRRNEGLTLLALIGEACPEMLPALFETRKAI